jgi:hypothetical protein
MRRSIGAGVVLALCVSWLDVATAAAQLPPVPSAMERLDFLLGDWEGAGWMEYAPGQRGEFRGTERVERRMGGRVVVIEGSFTAWMGPDLGDRPVHQALGIVSWDAAAQRFAFRTYTAAGSGGDAKNVEVDGDGMVWGYDDPNFGEVRFTIALTPDGRWHEVGHVSQDGGADWRQVLELTLVRR